jgi:predicted extracellular nuclease
MNRVFFALFLFSGCLSIQMLFYQFNPAVRNKKRGDIRIMFYNTENYFDTNNDSLKNDEEFLPDGAKHWTTARYHAKTLNLYKTIAGIGEEEPPEIICLAEIENKHVLQELIYNTPLEKYPYRILHFDSPDRRGIDVGILYRSDAVAVIAGYPLHISFPGNALKTTRDILCFKALINSGDTLNVFVNHWPSRMGGTKKSEPYRMFVAKVLRKSIDSVLYKDKCAQIVVTGDFNDEPTSPSIKTSLEAQKPAFPYQCGILYNLSENLTDECNCGTYRYRTSWNMFDQIIVSGALLKNTGNKLHTCIECVHIADFDFLFVEDEKYGGRKPFRTYTGPSYKGGFSDHLPVYLDIYY